MTQQLTRLLRGTYGLAAAFLLVIVLVFVALNLGDRTFNTKMVAVTGELLEEQRQDVLQKLLAISSQARSIQQVKVILEQVDWIHRVEVSRSWPDQLTVLVVKEKPIAYWNDDAFINADGKVFVSAHAAGGDLAQLYGPVGTEKLVMQQYQQLNTALLKSGQSMDVLVLDDRGSWHFTNAAGVRVLLGKDDIMERVQRYLQVVENAALMGYMDKIRLVDTRYSNGLAVSWKTSDAGLDIAKNYKSQRELRL
ncbi:MAG: cell division protein FtsQ/DivIB [Pseudomonadales bacterium]|jgi:cell division protein FtsQ|nr:cell division protein FtsQ/DivIB [Pseudomonadales bacterium]MDP4640654.1 cell division protein FtsQ/DivIB [Pseudomonadales bacterium]MDP4765715.1 cell division protein FtsQ/DivIB [Pseudomonadales bacterium]MDP4876450.1 cell division protein FtsQ/DivIB [Pseudomonadales bacterium]MDP5059316.1 cell division protein FtsQ/DivIB [Pseudomonadales bacterium]